MQMHHTPSGPTTMKTRFVKYEEESYYVYVGFNIGPIGTVERWDRQNWQAKKGKHTRLFHYRADAAEWLRGLAKCKCT